MPRKSVSKSIPTHLPISSPLANSPPHSLPNINNIQLVLQDLCGNPISSPFTPLQICNNDISNSIDTTAAVASSAAAASVSVEPATLKNVVESPRAVNSLVNKQI